MDKNTAIHLIEETFSKKFDEDRFTLFIKNLLNDVEPRSNFYSGQYIWDDHKEHINTYKRIGKYVDPDGEALDVLMVEVKSVLKLERARTTLRNFVIKHLSKFEKDYALVAFYSKEDDGADWRFSFIKLEHQSYLDEEKQKVKTRKEFTPAKRYSFLVGKYEKAYTAKNQLLPLLQNVSSNPTLEELENAFSIEKVTDEFFTQYKDLYVKLYEHFENDNHIQTELNKANIDTSRFTKKLLGQIVFLYFLQKKGWLGVPETGHWGKGKKRFIQELFDTAKNKNLNFFKDYLQYLFYEALAKERNNDNSFYPRFNCRIPFLNGGLFEAEYDWQKANISIPEDLFRNNEKNKAGDVGTGVLDVFDRYNFTIKEDEPLDKEVAVDPEMLGKVFENMLDIVERKSKGAFYTPREIVHYMCQESLIHYLDNALNDATASYQPIDSDQLNMFGGSAHKKGQAKLEIENKGKTLVPKADIETYIRNGHFALEHDQRVASAGKETKDYKYIIPESIRQHADLIDRKLTEIRICDPAIGSGAFPVGLLHELVNAQLVIKPHLSPAYFSDKLKYNGFKGNEENLSESRYVYNLKRHIIQESIYGVDIDASAIDIARLRLWLSLVVDEDDLDPIETLPNLDYKIVCGNSLIGMPENAMHDLQVEKELENLKQKFYDETNESQKKILRSQINSKIRELLDSAETFAGYNIDFDFKLFFSEIWREKGGFDIVIANPPYVFTRGQEFDPNFKTFFDNYLISKGIVKTKKGLNIQSGKINLFAFFVLRAYDFSNKNADVNFIIPNNLLRATTYDIIREYLIKKTNINKIIDLGKGVFRNVTASVIIIRYNPNFIKNSLIEVITNVENLSTENYSKATIEQSYFKNNVSYTFNIFIDEASFKVIKKIKNNSILLGSICKYISPGIDGDKSRFVRNEQLNSKFKKLLFGKDFNKYEIKYKNQYIEYDRNKLNRAREEEIYLSDKIILQRISGGNSPLKSTLDKDKYYTFNSVNNIILKNGISYSLEFILACLNSEVLNWYYAINFSNRSELTVNISKTFLEVMPIRKINYSTIIFDKVVNYLLAIKRINKIDDIIFNFFESLINSMVYELYFPEELKAASKEILKHLGDLKPISDTMSPEEKVAIIQSEFQRLYDPSHPVRNNLETLDSIEEVRIIKEALK